MVLAEFLPHVKCLECLANDIVFGGPLDLVNEYADRYRYTAPLDPPVPIAAVRSLVRIPYDPVTYLCAMSRFLGPLFVPLIKLLQLPRKRVLLYSPAPVERAALVGFNLAELVHAAYVHAGHAPGDVRVRGAVGLSDLIRLKHEAAQAVPDHAWIAWTADKVFQDHCDVYDVFLDVSAFPYPHAARRLPDIKPMGHWVVRHGSRTETRDLRWSTRDLTLYMELAEQERQYEAILLEHGRPGFDEWQSKTDDTPTCGMRVTLPRTWHYHEQDGRIFPLGYAIVLMASLRVWLAEWWLIRSQLHVVLPASLVFPLGVRGDGGISTGIVDLSEGGSDCDRNSVHSDSVLESGDVRSLAESLKDAARSPPPPEADQESVYSQDDPLVAACGLGVPCSDRWKRLSSHSSSPSQMRPMSWAALTERSFTPAHPRFDPCIAARLPLETMSSVYLFTLWSSYIRAMHIQASAFLLERVRALGPVPEGEATPLLLHRTITLTARDFSALSLDASSELDRALLQNILHEHGPYTLQVARSWWPWTSG